MESHLFLNHHYGKNIYILNSALLSTFLAKLGHPQTRQPDLTHLITYLYENLFDKVVDTLFPKEEVSYPTRMSEVHPGILFKGKVIEEDLRVVSVDLARAGTLPSQICYHKLNYLFQPQNIRQDHFYISRKLNEKGEVVGVDVAGSKIGGDVKDQIVLLPDPMGATGSTIVETYHHYHNLKGGKPKMMIAMHLIITPEYLLNISKHCPDLKVVAIRLDRGLSPDHILDKPLGLYWKEEKGLNQLQYIVPGAGGLGEILNNSFC